MLLSALCSCFKLTLVRNGSIRKERRQLESEPNASCLAVCWRCAGRGRVSYRTCVSAEPTVHTPEEDP